MPPTIGLGHAAFEQGGGAAGTNDGFGSSMSDIFDDLFGDMMGRGAGPTGHNGRERGSDLRYNMEITLEDAFRGKTATIKIPTSISCETCSGTGAKSGSKPKTCGTCAGQGRVRAQQGFLCDRANLSDLRRDVARSSRIHVLSAQDRDG